MNVCIYQSTYVHMYVPVTCSVIKAYKSSLLFYKPRDNSYRGGGGGDYTERRLPWTLFVGGHSAASFTDR